MVQDYYGAGAGSIQCRCRITPEPVQVHSSSGAGFIMFLHRSDPALIVSTGSLSHKLWSDPAPIDGAGSFQCWYRIDLTLAPE